MNDSSYVLEVINQTVSSTENELSVTELCKIAGVSRSGYYAWIKAAPTREAQEEQDRRDFEVILSAYQRHDYDHSFPLRFKAPKGMKPKCLYRSKP